MVLLESLKRYINLWGCDSLEKEDRHIFFLKEIRRMLRLFLMWLQSHLTIRYRPIVKYIKKSGIKSPKILEVGSFTIGISQYLKMPIIGVDLNVFGPKKNLMKMVRGNASNLPFKNDYFDFVLSTDLIEHIMPKDRPNVINEMMRVSKKIIIIGSPCGEPARLSEAKAEGVYQDKIKKWKSHVEEKERFRKRVLFFEEHKASGIPDEKEIVDYIKRYGERTDIKIVDNESTWLWYKFTLAWMKYSYIRFFITIIFAIVLSPFLEHIRYGGAYRKVFIINKV